MQVEIAAIVQRDDLGTWVSPVDGLQSVCVQLLWQRSPTTADRGELGSRPYVQRGLSPARSRTIRLLPVLHVSRGLSRDSISMGHQESTSVEGGDRHPSPHGHLVNPFDLLAGAPCQLDLLKAKRRWGRLAHRRLARPPGTLEVCISCRSRHLTAGISRSGGLSCTSLTPALPSTEYRRSTGFTKTRRVRAPTPTTFPLSLPTGT